LGKYRGGGGNDPPCRIDVTLDAHHRGEPTIRLRVIFPLPQLSLIDPPQSGLVDAGLAAEHTPEPLTQALAQRPLCGTKGHDLSPAAAAAMAARLDRLPIRRRMWMQMMFNQGRPAESAFTWSSNCIIRRRRFASLAAHDAIKGRKIGLIAPSGKEFCRPHGSQLFSHGGGDKLVDADSVGLCQPLDLGLH
jgi:hypothetical protein